MTPCVTGSPVVASTKRSPISSRVLSTTSLFLLKSVVITLSSNTGFDSAVNNLNGAYTMVGVITACSSPSATWSVTDSVSMVSASVRKKPYLPVDILSPFTTAVLRLPSEVT